MRIFLAEINSPFEMWKAAEDHIEVFAKSEHGAIFLKDLS
jgi:hypothetical protein